MNKKIIFSFSLVVILTFVLFKYPTNNIKTKLYNPQLPTQSGIVDKLPWDEDNSFKKAISEHNTPVLMAAYCTVLKDPLPGEEENVHLAASSLCGIVVNPGEVFAQNKKLGPYTESKGYKKGPTYMGSTLTTTVGGGVCKIASTLYNVSILSNLKIVERHNHNMPVPYVPYGQDATVAYGGKDFKFLNNTSHPILIWCQGLDNVLYMGFYGVEYPPKITWNHEILKTTTAPKVYKYNPNLEKGTEKIIIEGMDGATIKSFVTIYNEDNTTNIKNLGISHYRPMPYIIERNN